MWTEVNQKVEFSFKKGIREHGPFGTLVTGAVVAGAALLAFRWLSPVWRVPIGHAPSLIHSSSSPLSTQPGFHSKPLSSEATLISLMASCSCCSPGGAETPGHHSPRPLVTGATLCEEASGTSKHHERQESLVATGMSSAQGWWRTPAPGLP